MQGPRQGLRRAFAIKLRDMSGVTATTSATVSALKPYHLVIRRRLARAETSERSQSDGSPYKSSDQISQPTSENDAKQTQLDVFLVFGEL